MDHSFHVCLKPNLEAVASLGQPLAFEPLKNFFAYLEEAYGGIRRDRMNLIRDFQWEKGDTPNIMYARLARFARETGDAFIERQLVALYCLSRTNTFSRWLTLRCSLSMEDGVLWHKHLRLWNSWIEGCV